MIKVTYNDQFSKINENMSKGTTSKLAKPLDTPWLKKFAKHFGIASWDEARDASYIEQGYQVSPIVYSVVKKISKTTRKAKWKVMQKVVVDGEETLIDYNDVNLQKLLDKPNGLMTWSHLMEEAVGFKLLTGNTFFWMIPPEREIKGVNAGTVQSLWVLPTQHMQIHAYDSMRGISHYNLDWSGSDGGNIDVDEVIHIREPNYDYDENASFLYGQSPLQAALRTMQTNNDAVTSARNYILNQGPQGLLMPKSDDKVKFDKTAADKLKALFRRQRQGPKNAGDLHITPKTFDYLPIGIPAADLQLLEQYQMTKVDICNVFDIPPMLFGILDQSYENQKEAKKAMWSDVIIPILDELKETLNANLISKYGDDLVLEYDISHVDVLQEDQEKKAKALLLYSQTGTWTVNELRDLCGLMDMPDGDKLHNSKAKTNEDTNQDPEGQTAEIESNEA